MTLRKNRPGRKIARKIKALDHMKVNVIAHEMNYTGNHRPIISAIENTEANITFESAKPLRTKKDRSKRGKLNKNN